MIWAEIKKAINNTLGKKKFKSLDKLILRHSYENYYNTIRTLVSIYGDNDKKILVVPKGIEKIESNMYEMYEDYINAETIVLPLGIKEIGATAFKHFKNLKYIIIPDGVTTIGLAAFSMLSELNDIIIPDTVTRIDPQVFFGTDNCNIYLGFSEGEVEGAPWSSEGTLHYDSDF